MRAILILAILLTTGPATAEPVEAPEINMYPDGLPGQSFELLPGACVDDAGTFLTKPRADAINAQILFMFRYRLICQDAIDSASIEPGFGGPLGYLVAAISGAVLGGLVAVLVLR